MLSAVVALRLALAAVFAGAAAAKLLEPGAARALALRYRLPWPFARAAALVPAAELAVAVSLLVDRTSRAAGAASAALVVVFSAFVVRNLVRGSTEGCGCFGKAAPEMAARAALLRNAALVAASVLVASMPAARAPTFALALGLAALAAALAAAARGRMRSAPAAPAQDIVRVTYDRRRVLALGAGSAIALALPGTSLAEIATSLTGQTGVRCPSCGECTICVATGSPPKLTCRPCAQKCSTHKLCASYANKLPAYVQLASYLQSQGYAQSKDSVAQGLEQNGKLTVFGTSTEFAGSSTKAPRATLFYSLTNSGGDAWAALVDAKGHVESVAVAGAGGRIMTAAVPARTKAKRRTAATRAPGYGCGPTCVYAASVAVALATTIAAPEEGAFVLAKSLLSASVTLAGPSSQDQSMLGIVQAIQAANIVDAIRDGLQDSGIDALCNELVCSYSLQACCSYGTCYDSLSACSQACPESLAHQAPCLVYLTGHGARTYLGRF